jgi:hypothetical protein
MSRAGVFALLLCAVLGCAPAPMGVGADGGVHAVAVNGFPERVVYGAAFEFELVRECAAPLELEPFDAARLAPLLVRTLSVATERQGGRVMERRRLRAHALALGDAPLSETVFRARFGGRDEEARLVWPPLVVETSLAANDDGAAEVPLAPLGPKRSVLPLLAAALVVAASIARFAYVRSGRARTIAAVAAEPPAPISSDAAFDGWIRELESAAAGSDDVLYGTLVAVVRRVGAVRLGRDLASATARELTALLGDVDLVAALARSEFVRFGLFPVERSERAADIDVALRFVETERERSRSRGAERTEAPR